MASLNRRRSPQQPPQGGIAPQRFEPSNVMRTHEGAPAANIPVEMQLRRAVCSCLLWEDTFYESGISIADRIAGLSQVVDAKTVADLAYDARSHFHLRHVPLLLAANLCRKNVRSRLVSDTIRDVIQRPDEISEFVSIYAKMNGVEPKDVRKKLSAQAKLGLAAAFNKFDQYQLAKYFSASGEKGAVVRARDVMFLAHPSPKDEAMATLFKRIANKEQVQKGGADTWEVKLSGGADKRETFEGMLRDGKLGYMALLRNLRNMEQAKVDLDLIRKAIVARKGGAWRVLPFRYIAAQRAAPTFTAELDFALGECVAKSRMLPGMTVFLIDVSGSMESKISGKSDLNKIDAAAALGAVANCERSRIFTFSDRVVEVLPGRGGPLDMCERILKSQDHRGTYLGQAVLQVTEGKRFVPPRDAYGRFRPLEQEQIAEPIKMDRLIVISDEQAHDHVPVPLVPRAYMINVAAYEHGVGYGEPWVHFDGFSEQVIRFINEYEQLDAVQPDPEPFLEQAADDLAELEP